jgi:hypothetical protein
VDVKRVEAVELEDAEATAAAVAATESTSVMSASSAWLMIGTENTTYERQRVVAGREQAGEWRSGERRFGIVGHSIAASARDRASRAASAVACASVLLTMRGGVPTQRRPSFVRA